MSQAQSKSGFNGVRIPSLKSPIFWRITAGVFISILVIEIVLLVHSWSTERARLLERLDDSLISLSSVLDQSNPVPQLVKLVSDTNQENKSRVIGFAYKPQSGRLYQMGETNKLVDQVSEQSTHIFNEDSGHYTTLILTGKNKLDKLWLRVDASYVSAYMQRYIYRILGMVLLISIFVTAACLVFLHPLLIKPLQRLSKMFRDGEKFGLESTRATLSDLKRKDELGSVFRAFERLQTELITSENENSMISHRFSEFANLGADCFWEVDRNQVFTYVGGDVKSMLGKPAGDFIGCSQRVVLRGLKESIPDCHSIARSLVVDGTWEGTIHSPDSGVAKRIRIIASPCHDASGEIDGLRGTIVDITKEASLTAELKYQATHDSLTGLLNRRALSDELRQGIERYKEDGTPFCLLVLDLDRFKAINDTCGHTAGDLLIKTISSKLESICSADNAVARMGGDEFSIVLHASDLAIAESLANEIRMAIEGFNFNWESHSFNVTASIGIAQICDDLTNLQALEFAADSCCMKAKDQGKNQIQIYSADDQSISLIKDEALWVSRISDKLETNGFVLMRQSIVPLSSNVDEEHFEILLRMRDDSDGFWSPGIFIPIAERNDLMPKLDQWVVTHALDWLCKQDLTPESNFCMNINLSGASLADSGFRQFLRNSVERCGELNKLVCYEVTETAAMTNYVENIKLLNEIKQHGCRIALDDFGTGFSSLSHIRELPLDFIKIDGLFIRDIHNNTFDQALVKSIVEIARVLKMQTVAEFVDSQEALSLLKQLEINYAQGFLFAEPVPLVVDDADTGLSRAA